MHSKKKLKHILLGNALKSNELEEEKLGPFCVKGIKLCQFNYFEIVAFYILTDEK